MQKDSFKKRTSSLAIQREVRGINQAISRFAESQQSHYHDIKNRLDGSAFNRIDTKLRTQVDREQFNFTATSLYEDPAPHILYNQRLNSKTPTLNLS
jgi:hypothetical protein